MIMTDPQYLHCGLIDSLYRRKAFCTGIVHLSAGFHHTSSLLVLGPDTIMYTEKTGLYFSPHTLPTFISAGAQIGDFKLIVSNTESHLYTKTTNTWIFPPLENCTVRIKSNQFFFNPDVHGFLSSLTNMFIDGACKDSIELRLNHQIDNFFQTFTIRNFLYLHLTI